MSNFPSVRPSLNLQFDSQPTPADMTSHLASVGATFSRASIGTYTDANGLVAEATAGQARPNYSTDGVHEGLLIEEARTNLIKSSEDFSTTDWTTSNSSITVNQAISPDGTASADKYVGSTTDQSLQHTISVSNDFSYSVYVKYINSQYIRLRVNTTSTWFDIINGTIGTNNFDDASIEDVGNDWYKLTVINTTAGSFTTAYIHPHSSNGTTFEQDGAEFYLWGAQLEAGSFLTSYIPTIPTFTSRASDGTYFDSSGVLQTASTDVARIDHKYIDGEWVEAGLLLEGASTNLLVRSQDLSTTWSTSNTTVTTNQVNGLDGTLTADLLKEDSANANHYLSQSGTFSSGTTYTFSTFAKNASGTRYLQLRVFGIGTDHAFVNFDLVNGEIPASGSGGDDFINATIEDVGNGWYRCSMTGNYSETPTGFMLLLSNSATAELPTYTGNNTSGFYIWGAQLEEGSQPTSYIKTVSSTVTRSADVYTTATKVRSADVCYIDGTAFTDFYNQEEGTYFVKFNDVNDLSTSSYILNSDDGTNDERVYLLYGSGGTGNLDFRVQDDGSNAFSDNIGTIAEDTTYNVAIRIKAGNYRGILDGTDVSTDNHNATPSITNVYIGSRGGGSHINSKINKFIYFPRGLSNNELIKLTQ